jgi:hypothetical protein
MPLKGIAKSIGFFSAIQAENEEFDPSSYFRKWRIPESVSGREAFYDSAGREAAPRAGAEIPARRGIDARRLTRRPEERIMDPSLNKL